MSITLHKSSERGLSTAPWLVSRHSFSFNNWYRPDRIQFGALRVLNDDLITGGGGFPPHSHQDMEIITIPLQGAVAHEDSSGGKGVVRAGQVQIMSAGSGVVHSEFNASATDLLELLQVWIMPEQQSLPPRYAECEPVPAAPGTWQTLVSPQPQEGELRIFQQAWISRARINADGAISYQRKRAENGVYVFVVSGSVRMGDIEIEKRDAVGVVDESVVDLQAKGDSDVLVFDVPLSA